MQKRPALYGAVVFAVFLIVLTGACGKKKPPVMRPMPGGGALLRTEGGILTAGRDGRYGFANAAAFAADLPNFFRVPLDRPVSEVMGAP